MRKNILNVKLNINKLEHHGTRVFMRTLEDQPRSLILAPIESAYMTSYCTSMAGNLGPTLPHFRDIRAFVR